MYFTALAWSCDQNMTFKIQIMSDHGTYNYPCVHMHVYMHLAFKELTPFYVANNNAGVGGGVLVQ